MKNDEKYLKLIELLKDVTTISKRMPEIVFTYFQTLESNKFLRPLYNLIAEAFADLFSTSFLFINQSWSQSLMLFDSMVEKISYSKYLIENPHFIDEFIKNNYLVDNLSNKPISISEIAKNAGLNDVYNLVKENVQLISENNISVLSFFDSNSNSKSLETFGINIASYICVLFEELYSSFKKWGYVKDISLESDEKFDNFSLRFLLLKQN